MDCHIEWKGLVIGCTKWQQLKKEILEKIKEEK